MFAVPKRRWLWLVALLLIALPVVELLLSPREVWIPPNLDNEITGAGHTQRDVERLVGGPPGDYTTAPYDYDPVEKPGRKQLDSLTSGKYWEGLTKREWITDEWHLIVGFDREGKVRAVTGGTVFSSRGDIPPPPWTQRFLRSVRLWLARHLPPS